MRAIEKASEAGDRDEDLRRSIRKTVEQYLPLRTVDDMRKDNISHFVLRLAFCRKQEDRNWLCQQETALFKYRFENETMKEVDAFMRLHQLHFEQVSGEERREFASELKEVYRANRRDNMAEDRHYFKVPFEQAIGLMQRRQVFLNQGYAYVPRKHLIELLRLRFRENLSRSLSVAFKSFPKIAKDDRLAPLVKNLSRQYMGRDFGNNKEGAMLSNLKAEQIGTYYVSLSLFTTTTTTTTNKHISLSLSGTLAKRSFPMCMSNLHRELLRQHHLKHSGRMQFGLFLKGIGLSLDEAMRFWKREFTKKMTAEDFDKGYAYNIRHNYGKEGKRANYTPYSCKKIILGETPAHGQHHGCPFKHWNEQSLRARLAKLKVSSVNVNEIVEKVRTGDYQVACLKHFQVTHPGANTADVGNHPNAWFEASARHHGDYEDNSADHGKKGNLAVFNSLDDLKKMEVDDASSKVVEIETKIGL